MTTSTLRGIVRSFLFASWTLILVIPYLVLYPLGRWIRRPFVKLWHRSACFLIGMKVNTYGSPCEDPRVLLAGNHISYLDIPVLASLFDVTFVAKSEVASWPVFGFLARIAQTAFIERKPSKVRQQKVELKERILSGERLMIFPEGTSSKGETVLPYKSALFEMVCEDDLRDHCLVQPVTISFSRSKDNKPLDSLERDNFAWYGDMTLPPHLWKAFCLEGVNVDVIFHAPARPNEFKNRKELAIWMESRTHAGLRYLLGDMGINQRPVDESSLGRAFSA